MKYLFRRTRPREKALCLFILFAFLSLTVSCSHSPDKSAGRQDLRSGGFSAGETQTAKANSGEDPWWKKPEYEWMIISLIVIGVGIVVGGAIMISSGTGGLSFPAQK